MSISMPVRSKATSGALRRRRISWVSGERQATEPRSGAPASTFRPQAAQPVHRSLRQGGASEDRALYSCGCGCAFDAPVSTSVDCPHCGDRQAW
jgi:hypothetical protein